MANDNMDGIHSGRLFAGSCIGLIATAMSFAVMGAIMNSLKAEFLLTNTQVGWIGGAQLWGFPVSILIFGPLCSTLGMRLLLRLAFLCHAAGVLIMIFAGGFGTLFMGALTIAFGNGLIEGACNPLIATLYPDRKTEKLNNFHVWFPGGIVIGGVFCWLYDKAGIESLAGLSVWQVKLAAILIPTVIYGAMMFAAKYPRTEAAQAGVTFGGMMKATLTRPLFLVLFVCMMMTASIELGPGRWIPAILEAGGMAGILVLCYINGLMAVLRQFAGPVVAKLSPTGILLGSAILSGIGLVALSFTPLNFAVLIPATVFAIGVCYFWPTMLGVVSERVPKGGEMALALMGFAGNVGVGLITIPLMGGVIDTYAHDKFDVEQTAVVIQHVQEQLPALKEDESVKYDEKLVASIDDTVALAASVLEFKAANNALKPVDTANVLRGAIKVKADSAIGQEAKKTLDPAELWGGRVSFRYVACLAIVIFVVFGILYLSDRSRGGYKVEKIVEEGA